MSDNRRQYRALRNALTQGSPSEPTGHRARPLTTCAALMSGIVASQRTQMPHIAAQVPDGTKAESRVKRLTRWLSNAHVTQERYGLPSAAVLLAHWVLQTLVLVIDGSMVGRGCVALMLPVGYTGRALPLTWLVRQGQKGHFPADLPSALVKQGRELLPAGASVGLLGDGEVEGVDLQPTLEAAGWSSGCRTGMHRTVSWDGATLRLDTLGACLTPGTRIECKEVRWTGEA